MSVPEKRCEKLQTYVAFRASVSSYVQMKELDFDRDIVPLRDRMFRYAQSLLLCALS